MGHYPFTPFNGITALLLILTLVLAWRRFRSDRTANWPLIYYAAVVGYTIGFSGGLNGYWVAAGVVCGAAIRFGVFAAWGRWLELVPLAYITWRAVSLLLMW